VQVGPPRTGGVTRPGTPGSNPSVKTIVSRLEASAGAPGTLTFVGSTAPGGHDPVPRGQLHEEARAVAAALQARGVGPGDHVALLGPTSRRLVTAIQATWLAGATLVCLPLPMRRSSSSTPSWPRSSPSSAATRPSWGSTSSGEPPETEVGELELRGASVTPGYFRRDDVTAGLAPHRGPRLPRRR